MRKFSIVSLTVFLCIVLAGFFGIIHDQVTYTISPEYFTKFKYRQFGFDPVMFGGHRRTVALIGFLATWWTGFFIGLVLSITALGFADHKSMKKAIRKAILVTFCCTISFSFIGYVYGRAVLIKTGVNWWLPGDLADRDSFIIVGSIHNFSYIGGLVGLIAGLVYLIWKRQRDK